MGYSTYRHSGSVGPRRSTAMIGATIHAIAGDVRFDALSGTIITGVAESEAGRPETSLMLTNYPNPFNPVTTFQLTIVDRLLSVVKVFDVLGREVATVLNEVKDPGTYAMTLDAFGLAAGVYLARLESVCGVPVTIVSIGPDREQTIISRNPFDVEPGAQARSRSSR